MSNTAVFGIFATRSALVTAMDRLRDAGFRNTDVSVLAPVNEGTKDIGHEKATKAPEGATAGAASGALLGGILGWLAGVGSLAIPGVGPLVAAGPIMAALAGAGGAGIAGGVLGSLAGMGVPEYEAKRYEGRVKSGGILLSVHCDSGDWEKRAEQILKECGAEDVSKTSESSADYAITEKPLRR